MRGVILCTERERQLRPITNKMNKTLIEFGGISILERIMECMLHCNIRETYVVLGYRGNQVHGAISPNTDTYGNMDITYITNRDWKTTKSGASVKLASGAGRSARVMLVGGDHLIDPRLLLKLRTSNFNTGIVSNSAPIEWEQEPVCIGSNGMIEKIYSRAKDVPEEQRERCVGRMSMAFLFTERGWLQLQTTLSRFGADLKKHDVYSAVNKMIQLKIPFYYLSSGKYAISIVETHEDFERAGVMFSSPELVLKQVVTFDSATMENPWRKESVEVKKIKKKPVVVKEKKTKKKVVKKVTKKVVKKEPLMIRDDK